MQTSTPEYFWSRVNKDGNDNCWPWSGKLDSHGYGQLMYHGEHWLPTRLALVLSGDGQDKGPELLALHSCGNKACCNPAHLYWGTHKDKSALSKKLGRDMWTLHGEETRTKMKLSARARYLKALKNGNFKKMLQAGERKRKSDPNWGRWMAKINWEQAGEIRALRKEKNTTLRQLGTIYGLSDSGISRIINGNRWKE